MRYQCSRYLELTVCKISVLQTDPKRLKKELPKALKTIKPEDRILLVGTSRCPFDGEMKPMTGCYQRIILIPRPDYASRHCKSVCYISATEKLKISYFDSDSIFEFGRSSVYMKEVLRKELLTKMNNFDTVFLQL